MDHPLRNALTLLAVLALLASSIGVFRLQYGDPDGEPGAISQGRGDTSPVSAVPMTDDHGVAKHAGCNHGCHTVNYLLTHLNTFSAISTLILLGGPVTSLLDTPVPSMLVESFFKPPR